MTTRKNMLQVSRCEPQTDGRTTHNQPNSDLQSRFTRHQQLPSQLTVFMATYSRSSPSLTIPRKSQLRLSTSLGDLNKPLPRPSTSLSDLSKTQPRPSNSFSDSRKPQPRSSTSLSDLSKSQPRSSNSLSNTRKPQPRISTSLNDLSKPQLRTSSSFSDPRKAQSRTSTSFTIHDKFHSRPSTAQLVSNDGRSRKDDRSNEQAPEDSVSRGIVNTDIVSPTACADRLFKTAHKEIRISEMKQKSAKTSRRKNILKQLNMEDFPSYWYTTVVPATDVYVHRPVNSYRGLGVKSRLDTSLSRQTSTERALASANNTVSGSYTARPMSSRLICHISPVTTTQLLPADLPGSARHGQYGVLYDIALQRQRETCKNKEEILRRKVKDFLVSLDKAVKSKPLFSI